MTLILKQNQKPKMALIMKTKGVSIMSDKHNRCIRT